MVRIDAETLSGANINWFGVYWRPLVRIIPGQLWVVLAPTGKELGTLRKNRLKVKLKVSSLPRAVHRLASGGPTSCQTVWHSTRTGSNSGRHQKKRYLVVTNSARGHREGVMGQR